MFLTEQDLRDTFWANYNYNNRAIKYQFECPLRQGNIDLMTVEKFQEQYQINAFEFKLDDIKKVLLQAKGNVPYCNKSWIVVPEEKKESRFRTLSELSYGRETHRCDHRCGRW